MDSYNYIILPLIIFFARIVDVSIGTIRLIYIAKGYKKVAALLGFFEVLIWITVVKAIIMNMQGIISLVAYAAGFAAGTYIGMFIEEKFLRGHVLIRVITRRDPQKLIEILHEHKYVFTTTPAEGPNGPAKIIFMITDHKSSIDIINVIKTFNPKAFYSIENVKYATEIHSHFNSKRHYLFRMWSPHRKGK